MTRDGSAAIEWAKGRSSYEPPGMCQKFTRSAFDIGPGFGSARQAWVGANKKHPAERGSDVPAGVPVYWLGGSRGFGHTAVSMGDGLVRSTDWPRTGSVGTARIDDITNSWHQTLVGWAEDINGTPIPGADKHVSHRPAIDLSNVIKATKTGGKIKRGHLLKTAVAKEVGKGKMNLASPVLGKNFKTQYKLVQKKYGAKGAGVDGVPGKASLKWLGKRQGFDVVA